MARLALVVLVLAVLPGERAVAAPCSASFAGELDIVDVYAESRAVDFDGDGIYDVAATTWSGAEVIVLRGQGDGRFQTSAPVFSGIVDTIEVSDFNVDGSVDLLVGHDSGFAVLLGNGDGTFQSPLDKPLANRPYFMAVGDFDDDGIADVATRGSTANEVLVFLGLGDGSFGAPASANQVSCFSPLRVSDLDGDGVDDFVVGGGCGYTSTSIEVFISKADGTFRASHAVLVFLTPTLRHSSWPI